MKPEIVYSIDEIINDIRHTVDIHSRLAYLKKSGQINDFKYNGFDENGIQNFTVVTLSAIDKIYITITADSSVEIK